MTTGQRQKQLEWKRKKIKKKKRVKKDYIEI